MEDGFADNYIIKGQKKREGASSSKLQGHEGFAQTLKLLLNLYSLRWLSPSLNAVISFKTSGILYITNRLWSGLVNL